MRVVQATAPSVGHCLAHKAQWHGFQPICIANSPSAVRCSQRTSDCYEVNRVSVAPREADAVGSLKVCRGGTAVGETREEGGVLIKVLAVHFCRERNCARKGV